MASDVMNRLKISLLLCIMALGYHGYAQIRVGDSLTAKLQNSVPDTNRVKLLITLAFLERAANPVHAQKYRSEIWRLSQKLNFDKGKGWYYYLEGVALIYKNKFSPALNAEAKAIQLGLQIGDYDLLGRAYNAIGINYLQVEEDSSAMKAFQTALHYINHSTDQTVKPALLLNVGKLYQKLKNYPKALSYFERSSKNYTSLNNQWGLSLAYLETGKVHQVLEQYSKAVTAADLSLNAARSVGYTRTQVNAHILLGSSYLAINNIPKATANFKTAADSATLPNMHTEKLQILNGTAALAEKGGRYQEAFLLKRKATALSDSIFNANRSRLILEFQEKFQTEQKEAENKLLRNQQVIAQNKFRQRNQVVYLTLSILVGLVVFSCILFWGNRHIKKSNQLLTEQKDQIQQQKDNVEQLNQIKDKLFSLIAHDLRSPFASMKSMIDMYDEGTISKEDMDFFFKEIRKDIGFNSLLLDNLLIWAKSQLHGFSIHPKPISVAALADQVLYHFKNQLDIKEISIVKSIQEGSAVLADYEMTNTVFRNLIGNAIKFTPKKGSIKISCVEDGCYLEISISDTGIGIPEENKEKIFQDVFFTTQGLNKEKGTGLGLQICKEFVEKNNGEISVHSEVGRGTTFCFTLLKSEVAPAELSPVTTVFNENAVTAIKEGIKDNISLQMKYDRYELLSKVSLETIWESDLLSKEISWNEALNTNFGYPDERTTIEWWEEKIHPDDFSAVKQSAQMAKDTKKQDTWEREYRFRCADGSYKYVRDRGFILYDDNKKPFRMIGTMQNIDPQKTAMKEIQRLSLVATNVNNMVVITDAEDKVVWVNEAFVKHTGYSLVEIIGDVPQSFLSAPEMNNQVLSKKKELRGKDFSGEFINYTRNGEAYWVQIDTTQYRDPVTNKTGYVSIQTVITERKQNEQIIFNQNRTLRKIAYICSHDVQMPLYSIMSLIKRLNSGNLSAGDFQEAIALLEMSAEKLDSLIYEIHNQISRIERESV